jgi:hypothetical protein
MFPEYAALVKNLRGVVYFDPQEEVGEHLSWLTNRFRYRILGVTPFLLDLKPEFKDKPFVRLVYPLEALEKLARLAADTLGIARGVCEAVVLASSYVCPILALGRGAVEELEKLSVARVESKLDLDNKGWKLHLRIADYTVLDLYQWSTKHASLLWKSREGAGFVEARKKRIEKDKKRYWRLASGDSRPWTFMHYLDLAGQLARSGAELRSLDESARAGLAIEAAVVIAPSKLK